MITSRDATFTLLGAVVGGIIVFLGFFFFGLFLYYSNAEPTHYDEFPCDVGLNFGSDPEPIGCRCGDLNTRCECYAVDNCVTPEDGSYYWVCDGVCREVPMES